MYLGKTRKIKELNFKEKYSAESLIKPRDAWYDGEFYASYLEKQLSGIHKIMMRKARILEDTKSVIDIGCGTGGFLLNIARSRTHQYPSQLVGIDLSPSNIKQGQERLAQGLTTQQIKGDVQVEFLCEDAMDLKKFGEHHFDLATMCLCLHEMPSAHRVPVVKEASRVAKRVLICDWTGNMPYSAAGIRNRILEFIAGPDHFSGFRDFTQRGGVLKLLEDCELDIKWSTKIDDGTIVLAEAQKFESTK